MKKALTIVLTGGGSGGHIVPLLSLARALKQTAKDCRVVYIGLKGERLAGSLESQFRVFDEVHNIPAGKFRRYHGESLLSHIVDLPTLALNTRDFFRLFAGIGYAIRTLRRAKPDVVFSKGGFVAVPVGIAARFFKIPIVTHDSDAVPGLANRIVGRFAKVHATGMPASYYKFPKESVRFVGIPLDERIKPVTAQAQAGFKKELGLPADSLVLLVGGAGLGARDINNKLLAIAPKLLGDFPKLYVIHIAGYKHRSSVDLAYKQALPTEAGRVRVLDFTADFYKYAGAAVLVISRAGATTVAELAAQNKAVILIPAPHLTGGHQLKNAEELKKAKAALVVANDATPDELLKVVSQTLKDKNARQKLATNLGALAKPDAAQKLAQIIIEAAAKK